MLSIQIIIQKAYKNLICNKSILKLFFNIIINLYSFEYNVYMMNVTFVSFLFIIWNFFFIFPSIYLWIVFNWGTSACYINKEQVIVKSSSTTMNNNFFKKEKWYCWDWCCFYYYKRVKLLPLDQMIKGSIVSSISS